MGATGDRPYAVAPPVRKFAYLDSLPDHRRRGWSRSFPPTQIARRTHHPHGARLVRRFRLGEWWRRRPQDGATTPLNAAVLGHVATWLGYFLVTRATGLARRLVGCGGPAIWFSPENPRSWYMIRSVAASAGMRVVGDPASADVAFHFDDSTWSPAAAPFAGRTINSACRDISKSHVNRVFQDIFGYRLGIDPMS